MPLYITATRCRHLGLRRIAITLLQIANRHEGMWNSVAAGVAASKVSKLEEEGLGVEAPMLRPISSTESQEWAKSLNLEEPKRWLTETWTAQSTWQDMPRVPDHQRIAYLFATADADGRTITMLMRYSNTTDKEPFRTRQDIVTF